MFSENYIVLHVNNVHSVIWIIFFQVLQNFELYTSLIVVFLFVFDDLQGNFFFVLMVVALNSYSKRPFTKICQQLISICNMVLNLDDIIAFQVVIAIVEIFLRSTVCFILLHAASLGLLLSLCVRCRLRRGFDFLSTLPKIVNMGKVEYFCPLVFCKVLTKQL